MTTAPPSTETHGRPPYKRLLKHERIVNDLLIGFIVPQRAPGWAGALDYTSLLYQRLYRDRTRWSKGETADPVLHVVVYNGDSWWDAPGPSKTVRRSSR